MCTPVPGGVGPMTIAMLMRNTADSGKRAYLNEHKRKSAEQVRHPQRGGQSNSRIVNRAIGERVAQLESECRNWRVNHATGE
eukprot:1123687-Pyramimonas_sp.AAC.1